MATGFGLTFKRTLHGNAPICQKFHVPAGDSTALYEGDVVELVPTTGTMDTAAEVADVTRATSGHILLGVVKSFQPDASLPLTGNYRTASTERYVNVIIDPDAVYEAQEDAIGGSITAALVGAATNVNLIVAAGSTSTGRSGTMIDSSTTTASAADLKVLPGVPSNGGSNYAGLSGGAILEIMILAPALKSTDSQS